MTDQIDAFTAALQAHLQPLLDDFMNLEVWARICIGDLDGDDEYIRDFIAEQLPGFDVNQAMAGGAVSTWTPMCVLVLSTRIKGQELRVEVHVTQSAITTVKLVPTVMPASLANIDLVKEFDKRQLIVTLSQ